MAEYIKRDAIKARLEDLVGWCQDLRKPGLEQALAMLIEEPAADVALVVHGHFVHDGPRFAGGVDWWHCSSCGRLVSGVETRFDYCPHCGAKMDGGDNNAAD